MIKQSITGFSSAHLKHKFSRQLLVKLLLMLITASFTHFKYRAVLQTFEKHLLKVLVIYTRDLPRGVHIPNSSTPTLNKEEFFSLWPIQRFETETVSSMRSCCSAGWKRIYYLLHWVSCLVWQWSCTYKKDKSCYERLVVPKTISLRWCCARLACYPKGCAYCYFSS